MTEANQNFSKVARLVDERGMAIILKNNRPRYVIASFSEYDAMKAAREKLIGAAVDHVVGENLEALRELSR
jgi:antitoxin Phd